MGIQINGCGTSDKATKIMFIKKEHCQCCNSEQDFYLYEVKKRITLVFVPIVNIQKKHGIFCSK